MSNPYLDDAPEVANPYLVDEPEPDFLDMKAALAANPQIQRISPMGDIAGQPDTALLTAVKDSFTPRQPTPQEIREAEFAKRAGVEPIPLGTRVLSGLDTGIRQGMATPGRLAHGAADLVLGATGAGDTRLGRWNADMLKQYADYEAQMQRQDVQTFGPDDIANQIASGTGRAVTELPLYIAPGMGAASPAQAVARSSAAGGVVGGGTQYAQDRGEGRGRVDAATYATASGLITALTTRAFGATGAESVFRQEGIQGIRRRLVQVLKDAGLEGAEEMADQAQQDILERYSRNPEKPFDATVKEVLMAGAIGGLVGGGVQAGKLTAEGAASGVRKAGDFLTVRDPEQDMLGNPIENIAPPAAAEGPAQTGFKGVEAAMNRSLQTPPAETANPYLDEVPETLSQAQSTEASQLPKSELVKTTSAGVSAPSPSAESSTINQSEIDRQSIVRAELEALPGAKEDLRRNVPALTSAQTDAGLTEVPADDNVPATKADLKALADFISRGGPNPFATKAVSESHKETQQNPANPPTQQPATDPQQLKTSADRPTSSKPASAAIRDKDTGEIWHGQPTHGLLHDQIPNIKQRNLEAGFADKSGRFITQAEAERMAGIASGEELFEMSADEVKSVFESRREVTQYDPDLNPAQRAARIKELAEQEKKALAFKAEQGNQMPEGAAPTTNLPKISSKLTVGQTGASGKPAPAYKVGDKVIYQGRQETITRAVPGSEFVGIGKRAVPIKEIQPLTASPKGATTEPAAPGTSTVRSEQSNLPNERQRGRVQGNPGMTAEEGSNPSLGAAAISPAQTHKSAPTGATVSGGGITYKKHTTGKWYRTDDSGNIRGKPAGPEQSARIEATHAKQQAKAAKPKKFRPQTVDGATALRMDKGSLDKAAKADPVEDWLNKAIERTDLNRGDVMEGVTGAPVWLTKAAANGVLRAVRAAYHATKNVAQAIQSGLEWLQDQKIKGFNEQEARVWLDKLANDERAASGDSVIQESRTTESKPAAGEKSKTATPAEQSEFARLQAEIVAAEAELMEAIRQTVLPPDMRQGKRAEVFAAKNAAAAKLNRLLVQQLKLMTSANVDVARSPEQTAEMISQTVDLLNGLADEIAARNARSQEIPKDLLKLRQDLQTRLNLLKGWTDDQVDKEAQGRAERDKPESLESRMRYMEIEGATNPSKLSFPYWYERFKKGMKKFLSPIPELPLYGERAQTSVLFKRAYRLFAVENNRVKKEAAEKVQAVLEPLAKLGRKPADNDALQQYYRLSERFANARKAGDETRINELAQKLHDLEQTTLNKDPFNLFRRLVLYRDFFWRGTYLKTEDGKPITLPGGLTVDEVRVQLRRLTKAISEHPSGLAITEALRRHYALMEDLRQSILAHGEIIPEALTNPTYFPHLLSEYYSDNLGRVNPTTEESFRKYLISPVGSDKLIQTDYLKAVLQHTAEVLSHNARADLVDKYIKSYDISDQLKAQHGDKWDHAYNLPPGYGYYAPYKKLPLRATYILPRDVLAQKLGVLFNDGDLRERMAGQVVKVKPEDLRTAMVAGEKIKWVLPTEIVDALHGIERREAALANQPDHFGATTGKVVRKGLNLWKQLKLFGPTSFARYSFGNLTTDVIDKVLAADPKIAAQMGRAAREVWESGLAAEPPKGDRVMDKLRRGLDAVSRKLGSGALSPEFKAAAREGVFETVTAAEVGALEKIPEFKEFMTTAQTRKAIADKALGAPAGVNSFRESVFRYAKFLADVERLRAGEELPFTGMYHKDIDALGAMPNGKKAVLQGDELVYARAAENSLKHFGDYNMLGVNTQWLRRYLMPFVSWTDVNLRYHAALASNMIDAFKPGASDTQRLHALRVSGAKIALTLGLIGLGKELWNQVGGPLLGLWDDDDDLENKLSPADRRRGHIILGKDKKGDVMVVYTPSAFGDVAEWVGGQNFKRLFLEYARGEITLDQWISDYAKQMPSDFANKLIQSAGPAIKGPYEFASGKSVFPDFFEQRTIPKSEQWWRFVGTMTDDRMANWVRGVFDEDYYNQPMAEQLQQIILQVRRRDPEAWAFYEIKDKASDWEFAKTGKRFSAGDYTAPEAMALRNFRKAIYRGDVAAADRFYQSLLRYGYTADRLDDSIRNQAPLSGLNEEQREEFVASLTERERKQLEMAEQYYERFSALDDRERELFPIKGDEPDPNPELLKQIVEEQK